MTDPTLIARDPCILGFFELGHARLGVYTPRVEQTFLVNKAYRSLYRGVACWNVDRDDITGVRVPTFEWDKIFGIIEETGAGQTALVSGVVVKVNATLRTLDGIQRGDRLKDTVGAITKYWEAVDVEDHQNPASQGGFSHRVAHLHYSGLYREY